MTAKPTRIRRVVNVIAIHFALNFILLQTSCCLPDLNNSSTILNNNNLSSIWHIDCYIYSNHGKLHCEWDGSASEILLFKLTRCDMSITHASSFSTLVKGTSADYNLPRQANIFSCWKVSVCKADLCNTKVITNQRIITKPDEPVDLKISKVGKYDLTASWNKPAIKIHDVQFYYMVKLLRMQPEDVVTSFWTTNTSSTFHQLHSYTRYCVLVSARLHYSSDEKSLIGFEDRVCDQTHADVPSGAVEIVPGSFIRSACNNEVSTNLPCTNLTVFWKPLKSHNQNSAQVTYDVHFSGQKLNFGCCSASIIVEGTADQTVEIVANNEVGSSSMSSTLIYSGTIPGPSEVRTVSVDEGMRKISWKFSGNIETFYIFNWSLSGMTAMNKVGINWLGINGSQREHIFPVNSFNNAAVQYGVAAVSGNRSSGMTLQANTHTSNEKNWDTLIIFILVLMFFISLAVIICCFLRARKLKKSKPVITVEEVRMVDFEMNSDTASIRELPESIIYLPNRDARARDSIRLSSVSEHQEEVELSEGVRYSDFNSATTNACLRDSDLLTTGRQSDMKTDNSRNACKSSADSELTSSNFGYVIPRQKQTVFDPETKCEIDVGMNYCYDDL